MKVLSLFDGMSCARITLEKLGVQQVTYYASEIDAHAIKETKANYPDAVHLGDVVMLRRVMTWKHTTLKKALESPWLNASKAALKAVLFMRGEAVNIDALFAGSPCQGFSFAGKQLAFNDPRSALFFEFVKILNHLKALNPNLKFMLENVKMKKQFLDVITDHVGVEPKFINSELVSAQSRQRYYWANCEIPEPLDRKIFLSDILERNGVNNHVSDIKSVNSNKRVKEITENTHGYRPHRGDIRKTGISELGRIYKAGAKVHTLTTSHQPKLALNNDIENLMYRKLTVVECCRLQGVPDDYFKVSSNTQAYKMLGNGWQVDTIEHIFKYLLADFIPVDKQTAAA